MARKHSIRSRNRPGGDPARPRGRGFTGPGYRQAHDWLLPGLAGAEKRRYFNRLSGAVVLAAGILGWGLGLACLGWFGGMLGLGVGLSAGGSFVERRRYYRG